MMTKIGSYDFDILSDMFITGADQTKAELRVPEIRGVLRWWFRVLGGFKSDDRDVKIQEAELFGSVHGEKGARSALVVRIEALKLTPLIKEKNDYFLFPLNKNPKGYFTPAHNAFTLHIWWNGSLAPKGSLEALITVFGHLGSLGMRTRRCYGALAFSNDKSPMSLKEALSHFKTPDTIEIKEYIDSFVDVDKCIQKAMGWLKGWRSVGPSNSRNTGPGMEYGQDTRSFAWRDHEIGRNECDKPAVRPALGMPILQKYGKEFSPARKDQERFASPIILRPIRSEKGFKLLVLFVEKYKWNESDLIEIKSSRKEHPVSLELYNAMKADKSLSEFIP
ncbi:MAG: type III-B CRISPR module RAMP protein Cmr1 [Kiritimatiellae bacterium]|nr:type III-B CRISPR module RAMP protein Cmr1 [Kiritimatiellia bacterium]